MIIEGEYYLYRDFLSDFFPNLITTKSERIFQNESTIVRIVFGLAKRRTFLGKATVFDWNQRIDRKNGSAASKNPFGSSANGT